MKIILSKIAFVSLLLACGQASAQNLLDIYQLALKQDTELLIAESDYLATLQAVPIADSARKPQISLNAQTTLRESDNSVSGSNSHDDIGYSLNLTQNLYNNDTEASYKVADATTAAQLALLQQSRQGLMLRVAVAYFEILAAQDNVDFAYAERTAIARQLEQAQKRFEVGLIAITDVHEAQARFDSAEAQAILAENVLENAFQSLQLIIGESPSRQLSRIGDGLELALPQPANTQDWVDLAMKNNPALLAAQASMKAALYERDRFARANYPTVDLIASYADSQSHDDIFADARQDDLSVRIELQVPLFTGGRIDAQRGQSESALQSAKYSIQLQNRLAAQQTRIAYLGVVFGISQVNALKQALDSSNVALEATRAGFEVGTRTSVDVLISLQETYRAQRDFAAARYDYLLNLLKLRQAAGILEEADLQGINRWLTP